MDIKNLTIEKAGEMLQKKEITSVNLVSAYLENIQEKDKNLNAYLEIFNNAIEQAQKADLMIQNGQATNLTGIPIAIKDNILIQGEKCSAASKMLENYVATYDAFVIQKLKEAGAVLIG